MSIIEVREARLRRPVSRAKAIAAVVLPFIGGALMAVAEFQGRLL